MKTFQIKEIYQQVADELNLKYSDVKQVYLSFWKFIKTTISSLPLKVSMTREEFDKLRTSFNISGLGKFYVSYDRIEGIRKKYKYRKKIIENGRGNEIS